MNFDFGVLTINPISRKGFGVGLYDDQTAVGWCFPLSFDFLEWMKFCAFCQRLQSLYGSVLSFSFMGIWCVVMHSRTPPSPPAKPVPRPTGPPKLRIVGKAEKPASKPKDDEMREAACDHAMDQMGECVECRHKVA